MKLEIVDVVSSGAGPANEDRAGAHGALAWVIDGATDVIQSPLAGEISDAHWLAVEIERCLRLDAAGTIDALSNLPGAPCKRIGGLVRARATACADRAGGAPVCLWRHRQA